MPIYSYECQCGQKFVELQTVDNRLTCKCAACGEPAKLVITSAPALDSRMGLDGAFTTAVDRFDRVHRQQAKIETKRGY
jgi:putative FmdB family regulatory protein